MRWVLATSKGQRSGRWMLSPKRPMPQASESNAARSVAFICVKVCAGVTRTVGEPAMIGTLSQKNGGRQPLHRAT
jgi:hypothetical protein